MGGGGERGGRRDRERGRKGRRRERGGREEEKKVLNKMVKEWTDRRRHEGMMDS